MVRIYTDEERRARRKVSARKSYYKRKDKIIRYRIEYRKGEVYKKLKLRYKQSEKGKLACKVYYQKNKEKIRIRDATRAKYGSLPEGFDYHHIPPYRVDVWIGMDKYEHQVMENNIRKFKKCKIFDL